LYKECVVCSAISNVDGKKKIDEEAKKKQRIEVGGKVLLYSESRSLKLPGAPRRNPVFDPTCP
jgi:hypothetical protein